MGKAKRYNTYDAAVSEGRKIVQSYGEARQKLSVSSSFGSPPLQPPIATALDSSAGTGTGTFCSASLAADQTTNIAATDHIEFDTLDEDGGITLQTGAGQADGIFELSAGKKYYLTGAVRPEFSGATGQLVMAWYDITNTAELGKRAIYEAQTHTSNNADQPKAEIVITPTANITVEFRIIAVTALTALATEYSQVTIFEIALGGSTSGGGGSGGGSVTFPITPDINDHGNVGTTTEDLDLSATTGHIHKLTLTGNPTLTFSNPPSSGTQMEFEIEFVQDATGGRTVTWPATVAETVTISTTASATTIITCRTNDGGTTYHAIPALRGSISLSGAGNYADRTLNNLTTTTINTSLISDTDVTDDLGSSSRAWSSLHVDLIELKSSAAAPTTTSTPTILLDGSNNMQFNVADQKQFFWTNEAEVIMQLDRDGVNNDTVLTVETDSTDAAAIPRIDIFRDDPSPANDDTIAYLRFAATESALGTNVYGQIEMEYENVTAGREAASMIFAVSWDSGAATSFLPFMALNTANDKRIRMVEDVEIVSDIILQSGDKTSKLSVDGGTNLTYITGSGTTGRLNFYSEIAAADVNIAAVAANGLNLFTDKNIEIATGYLGMEDRSDPSAPTGLSKGIFYVKDNGAGVSKPYFIGDGQAAIDLSSGGVTEFDDSTFRIQDNGDDTKELAFEVSAITTATTRTITMLDEDITIVGRSSTQVLQNKSFEDSNTVFLDTVAQTKKMAFDISPVTAGQTRTISVQDQDGEMALIDSAAQTFSGVNTFSGLVSFTANVDIGNSVSDTCTITAVVDSDILPSDGTKNLGDATTGWNNIYSDNTLFCSNLKVWTGDSDINVFDDLDMQAGGTVDFADTATTAGTGSGGTLPANVEDYIIIKVNGTSRRVAFYPA
jgi:hypothetical protein